jgi:hypothetical protein
VAVAALVVFLLVVAQEGRGLAVEMEVEETATAEGHHLLLER